MFFFKCDISHFLRNFKNIPSSSRESRSYTLSTVSTNTLLSVYLFYMPLAYYANIIHSYFLLNEVNCFSYNIPPNAIIPSVTLLCIAGRALHYTLSSIKTFESHPTLEGVYMPQPHSKCLFECFPYSCFKKRKKISDSHVFSVEKGGEIKSAKKLAAIVRLTIPFKRERTEQRRRLCVGLG